jgi:hypothetical protein
MWEVRFENIHSRDQTVLELVAMAHAGVQEKLAGVRIVNHLMHIHRDAAVRLPDEEQG